MRGIMHYDSSEVFEGNEQNNSDVRLKPLKMDQSLSPNTNSSNSAMDTPTPLSPPVEMRYRRSSNNLNANLEGNSCMKTYEITEEKIIAGSQVLSPRELFTVQVDIPEVERPLSPKRTSTPESFENEKDDDAKKGPVFTRVRLIALLFFVVLGSGLVLVWLLNPHIQASMRSDSQIESQNIQQLSIPVCALHASSRSYKVTGLLGIKCMEQVKNGSRITEYLENSPSELNIDVSDQTPSKLQLFFYLHYNSNSKQCMDLKSSVTCL